MLFSPLAHTFSSLLHNRLLAFDLYISIFPNKEKCEGIEIVGVSKFRWKKKLVPFVFPRLYNKNQDI
jgi:hypothetical protein